MFSGLTPATSIPTCLDGDAVTTTWTNPRTVAYNDAFPANQWNNEVRDNLLFLKARIDTGHGTTFPSSPSAGDVFNVVTSHFVLPMIYDGTKWVSSLWATEDLLKIPPGAAPLITYIYRSPKKNELPSSLTDPGDGLPSNSAATTGLTYTVEDYLTAGLTMQCKLEFDLNDGLGSGTWPRAGETVVQAAYRNDTRAEPGIHPAFEADSLDFPTAITGSQMQCLSHGHVVGPWTSISLPSDAFSVKFSTLAWLVNTAFTAKWSVVIYGIKVELRWVKT